MHPKAVVTVNGSPVAGLFWEKLVRLTIHDREGVKSDSIDIDLEDGPPAFLAIPEEGDIVKCWLGYEETGVQYMGAYKIHDVDVDCWPWKMQINGKAADLREKMKQHKSRHWDKKSFNDVASEIAGEHGLSAQIDADIGSHQEDWWGQEGESDLHFLERRAERLGGLMTIKDGNLIVVRRGEGTTPGGVSLPPLIVTPTMALKGTCKTSFGKREKHKQVSAEYHDFGSAKSEREDAPTGESTAEARYTMRHGMGSKAEAKRMARSRARFLRQSGIRTAVSIEGDPTVKAGRPLVYAGMRPGVDGRQFVIEDVTHTFSKRPSYRTDIKAKIKADGGGSGSATGSAYTSGAAAP